MNRTVAALSLALLAAPAAADTVLTLANHTDAMKMMGQSTPAKDETHTYWFGDQGVRYDMGEMSMLTRMDQQKFYLINHGEKSYSIIDLPFDFKSLVGPEMAPMMDMMAKQFAATLTVTPTDRTGSFAGYDCTYQKIAISMGVVTMNTDACTTERVPIDYERYKSLQESLGSLAPNSGWMKEMVEKVRGFPVRSDTTMVVMGSNVKSWSELKSVEEKSAPAGHYDPPAGYKAIKFDPMAQMQKQGRRG